MSDNQPTNLAVTIVALYRNHCGLFWRIWRAITDAARTSVIIERLAIDGTNVYGASEKSVYRLESGDSVRKQITPEIPDNVTSLAVDSDVLYANTEKHGVLHFKFDEK